MRNTCLSTEKIKCLLINTKKINLIFINGREKIYIFSAIILTLISLSFTVRLNAGYYPESFLSDSILPAQDILQSHQIVAKIGDEEITLEEFEQEFKKNIYNSDSLKNLSSEDKRNFLNLYLKYRLKVKDARDRGLNYDTELIKETEAYKRHLLPTLLTDKYIEETLIKKIYERRKDEVRVSHIMIKLNLNPAPEDSIRAYLVADTIIKKLDNGEDFAELAKIYSEDEATAQYNGGDLYYFTSGETVESFEDEAYRLTIGEHSRNPVRTPWGLHILKLTDRKPRVESVRISHIFINHKRDSLNNIIDSLKTYEHAFEIYTKAVNGENWDSLVMRYSEDFNNNKNGGDLGYIERRRMPLEIDSAAFSIKINDIYRPVSTIYGWHIIKKTGEKKYESYELQKADLKNRFKQTQVYSDYRKKFIDSVKVLYNFKSDESNITYLLQKFDSTKYFKDYDLNKLFDETEKNYSLCMFDGGTFKILDLLQYLKTNLSVENTISNNFNIRNILNTESEKALLFKCAEDNKLNEDSVFLKSVRDYINAFLVFKIDNDELWNKVKVSESEILNYYNSNKNKYTEKDTKGKLITKPLEKVRSEIYNSLQQIKFKDLENKFIEALKLRYPVTIYEEVLSNAFIN